MGDREFSPAVALKTSPVTFGHDYLSCPNSPHRAGVVGKIGVSKNIVCAAALSYL